MKTRYSLILTLFAMSIIFLAACGNSAGNGTPTAQNSNASATVSTEAKLALGILELSGSEQDITASQAAELHTLWQAYQALSDSDTTAQIELQAVIQQIQETLTADQMQAIDALQITAESMEQYLGSALPAAAPNASASDSSDTGQMAAGPQGMPMDGGGTPPDDAMMAGMGATGASVQTAAETVNQQISQGSTLNPMLLSVLLQMLETRAQASH